MKRVLTVLLTIGLVFSSFPTMTYAQGGHIDEIRVGSDFSMISGGSSADENGDNSENGGNSGDFASEGNAGKNVGDNSNTGTDDNANTGTDDDANTGTDDSANTGIDDSANTDINNPSYDGYDEYDEYDEYDDYDEYDEYDEYDDYDDHDYGEELYEDELSEDELELDDEAEDEFVLSDEEIAELEKAGEDDPSGWKYNQQAHYREEDLIPISEVFSSDDYLSLESLDDFPVSKYGHGKYASGHVISRGIDVSKWQGAIDWNRAKADGVEFAFIRVGARGYGAAGNFTEDDKYKTNITGASNAGIRVGVYMFSQATTVAEAEAEADYILARIDSYRSKITLPVVMDFEFSGGSNGRLTKANLSKDAATKICNAFCAKVENAGYEPMVYANYDMLTNHLNASQISNKYKIWIARWRTSGTGYSGDYNAWQFTDAGSVNGISGAVDLDFGYDLEKIPVVLHASGGVFEEGEDITIGVEYGDNLANALANSVLKNPERAGIDFKYWAVDAEGTTKYNMSTPITASGLELYAVWESGYNRTSSNVSAYLYDDIDGRGTKSYASGVVYELNPGAKVALETNIENTEIYYTVGSSSNIPAEPTISNAIRYNGPISIYDDTVIKAFSAKEGYANSAITTYRFKTKDVSGDTGQVMLEDLPGDDGMDITQRAALIPDGFWTSKIEDQVYNGKAIKPTPRVYYGKYLLEEKKDYTLSYSANTNVGSAILNVTGKGGYSGAWGTTFNIAARDISAEISAITPQAVIYNSKKNQTPTINLTVDGKKLTLNKDYYYESIVKLSESGLEEDNIPCTVCKEVGEYRFTIAAKENGNYAGSGDVIFSIESPETVLVSTLTIDKIPDQSYAEWKKICDEQGKSEVAVEPDNRIVVKDKKKQVVDISNFDITYKNNTSVGTATVTVAAKPGGAGSGNPGGIVYAGSKTLTFKITGYPMGKVTATTIDPKTGKNVDISKVLSFSYNGKPHMPLGSEGGSSDVPSDPAIEVSYVLSKNEAPIVLTKGKDYTISYLNNINKGTATVVFTGTGRFTGTLKKTFKITEFVPDSTEALAGHIYVEFKNADAKDTTHNIAEYEYIKGGITPETDVYYVPDGGVTSSSKEIPDNAILLTKNKDYTVVHSNNKAVADYDELNENGKNIAPSIRITGKNSFKGSVTLTYSIIQRDLSRMNISVGDKVASTKANQWKAVPVISDPYTGKNTKLVAGTDYDKNVKYYYDESVRISRYNSTTKKTTYAIVARGSEVQSTDIVPAGTIIRVSATGIKNYKGSISAKYAISSYDISKATVKIADQFFNGSPILPGKADVTSITYKIGKDIVPVEAYEYEIVPGSYAKNTAAGTGSLQIHGTGRFCGYKTVSFKITAKNMYYLVSFYANGGTGTMKTQSISKPETMLTNNAYKKNNYDFAGWNTKEDGSGSAYANKAAIANPLAGKSLELYAQWAPTKYTIIYHLGDGQNSVDNPAFYTVEDEVILKDAVPSASMGRMRFLGWYKDAKLTKPITKITVGSTGKLDLYADWAPDYDVVSLNVETHSADDIKAFVSNHAVSASDSWKVKPSLSGNIKAGTLSDATITSSFNVLNSIRYMAGLNYNVANDETYAYKASAATLLNALNGQLSHYPVRPSAISNSKYDSLYNDGRSGAGSSNIAWTSWSGNMKYSIINMWMEDSDSSNISCVGHRRWLLYPNMKKAGFGETTASDGAYYAIYAHDGFTGATGKRVAWPAQNTMTSYFAAGSAWSLSMGGKVNTSPGRIEIVLTNKKTGVKTKIKASYVENSNYGDPGCIIFCPKVATTAGSSYSVSVYLHDLEQEVKYDVNFF